ncbi:MAG: hypothetical protein WBC73_00435 [Phormidesmis sp.]
MNEIVPANGWEHNKLIAMAAQIGSQSNHPVAHSIRQRYAQPVDRSVVQEYEEIAGHGIYQKTK